MGEADLLAEGELVAGRRDRAVTGAAPHADERQQRQQLVVEMRARPQIGGVFDGRPAASARGSDGSDGSLIAIR